MGFTGMGPNEIVNLAAQLGLGGIFFYLFWVTRDELKKQNERHDQDIQRLYEMRVQELKLMARLPTDLEANYTMPQKTA